MNTTERTKSVVLLLTACVNPRGMCMTVLTDVQQRLDQYLQALRFYLKAVPNRIVFVENTEIDISTHFPNEIEQGRLECLSFNGNDYDKTLGKGYGEALIIEHAIQNSVFLRDASVIIKITGRVRCTSISSIVKSIKDCDIVYSDFRRQKEYEDLLPSVIVAAPLMFWKNFIDKKKEINDTMGVYFEHILKQTVDEWIEAGKQHSFFLCPILLSGMSGSTGGSYAVKYPRTKWLIKFLMYNFYVKRRLFDIHRLEQSKIRLGGGKRNAVSIKLLPLSNYQMCA